jgi:hypothetical protein
VNDEIEKRYLLIGVNADADAVYMRNGGPPMQCNVAPTATAHVYKKKTCEQTETTHANERPNEF